MTQPSGFRPFRSPFEAESRSHLEAAEDGGNEMRQAYPAVTPNEQNKPVRSAGSRGYAPRHLPATLSPHHCYALNPPAETFWLVEVVEIELTEHRPVCLLRC